MFSKIKAGAVLAVVTLVATAASANFAPTKQSSTAASRLCADIATNSVKMQIMGDSIMTDTGATEVSRGWPKQFKDYMATKGWTVYTDKAVAGSKAFQFTSTGPLASVTDSVRLSNPTLVTLNWRTNEQWNSISPTDMRNSYLSIIDTIRSSSPTTAFLIVNPPLMALDDQGGIDNYTTWKQADYIAAMMDVKAQRDTMWLDLRPYFPTAGSYANQLLPDGIHPSNFGHTVVAHSLTSALLNACG